MLTQEVLYGLLNPETGRLAQVRAEYNGANRYACGEYSYYLNDYGQEDWLLQDKEQFEKALKTTTEWYNADRKERPVVSEEIREWKRVRVTKIVEIEEI